MLLAHARAGRGQHLHGRHRDQDDIPGDPNYYVYRQAAVRGRRARVHVPDLALRLLAPARVEARHLRVPDRVDPARLRAGLLGARLAARDRVPASSTSRRPSSASCCSCVTLSAFMVDRMRRLTERETTSRIVLLALVPAMLVIAQPDLGSGLVYLAILAGGAVRGRHPVDPLRGPRRAWRRWRSWSWSWRRPRPGSQLLKPYQMDRLTAFLNPTSDPREEGYQINQSLTAIGSGGKTGRGDEATQTQARLPARAPHGLRILGGGRGVRFRRGGPRAVPLRPADLARL